MVVVSTPKRLQNPLMQWRDKRNTDLKCKNCCTHLVRANAKDQIVRLSLSPKCSSVYRT